MNGTGSRRRFLTSVGATGAAVGLWGVPAFARMRSVADKLNLAVIGCGGQGAENLSKVSGENIVALCDVDEERAGESFEKHPKARRFRDYRKLLDAMHAEIDAVVVTTPDHMHAPISLAAMELGKHVYCEKPLTWGIEEARRMGRVAREKRLATQMGTQGMAGNGSRAGIEILRSGVIGEVTELHVWTDRPADWWPQGIDRPQDREPVPSSLDWDLWLGVAPKRPYNSAYCPFVWRGWKDFGTGAVGDMGIHNAAMPFAALELGPPSSAELVETS
ncbi:MAG TPA: Gfo/Idh/MocA family oxidoreductase, partial [Isosphaeraceae bacterium]|nr:Gfo/Idh/MocA family oxidoreductase [Isosphaeraceae bacterium]